jgi:hypothetical protein
LHGPSCVFWANLTPFSHKLGAALAGREAMARGGMDADSMVAADGTVAELERQLAAAQAEELARQSDAAAAAAAAADAADAAAVADDRFDDDL